MKSFKQNMREHPLRTILIIVIGVILGIAWLNIEPHIEAHADVQRAGRSCPIDDPCRATKSNWRSPTHMVNRFKNGVAGNAGGIRLPRAFRLAVTRQWNKDHGVVGRSLTCGDHWWCKVLSVEQCAIQFFMCDGNGLTFTQTRTIVLKCGGLAIIGGATGALSGAVPGALAGVAAGGDGCLYSELGSDYGWW